MFKCQYLYVEYFSVGKWTLQSSVQRLRMSFRVTESPTGSSSERRDSCFRTPPKGFSLKVLVAVCGHSRQSRRESSVSPLLPTGPEKVRGVERGRVKVLVLRLVRRVPVRTWARPRGRP